MSQPAASGINDARPVSRWRNALANLSMLALSSLLVLMVLEFIVFRYVLVPDDLLENVSIGGVVRYMPDTRATFSHPDGRTSLVTINRDGWNSSKPDYPIAKAPGRKRIAVVGDSYVHAAYVDNADAFPEVMEASLRSNGLDVEVFRFGMDGAPLSQYLHVLRREVLQYQPDIVVVPLIHNDFDESYRFLKTRYASSFMKLRRGEAGEVVEVPPGPFRYGTADALRGSSTFRYLYYETNFYLYAKGWISRIFWGGNEEWKPELISSAVDIRKIGDHASNRFFARYVVEEMKRLAATHGFKLAFVMDGVREAVYAGRSPADYEVGMLNVIAADVTRDAGVPFLDLQTAFKADYETNRKRLEYPHDWHWNEHANRIVAREIASLLTSNPAFGLTRTQRAAEARPASAGSAP